MSKIVELLYALREFSTERTEFSPCFPCRENLNHKYLIKLDIFFSFDLFA